MIFFARCGARTHDPEMSQCKLAEELRVSCSTD